MKLITIKKTVAILFIFLGGFGLPTALLSLASPFTAETSTSEAALAIGIYIVMIVVGVWLAVSCRRMEDTD